MHFYIKADMKHYLPAFFICDTIKTIYQGGSREVYLLF